jgi:hypothetical protein
MSEISQENIENTVERDPLFEAEKNAIKQEIENSLDSIEMEEALLKALKKLKEFREKRFGGVPV